MKKKIFLIILLIFTNTLSQENTNKKTLPPISTDRPDNSDSPYTISKNTFQFETGVNYVSENPLGLSIKTLTINTGLFRYGFLDNLELRIGYDFIDEKKNYSYSSTNDYKTFKISESSNGLNPLLLGFKFLIQNESKGNPGIGFVSNLYLPFSTSKDLKPKNTGADFKFALSHSLNKTHNISYNIGVQWGNTEYFLDYIYSLVYGISIKDRLGLFFEVYGYIPEKSNSNNYWDSGITYLINNNSQIDMSIGSGIESDQLIYLNFGFSQRFGIKKL
mgnify:FL=1|tara:strand:+ start:1367 stop:2191 length:825 start_codon:yes stop_codon:yes gene_type:complete